MGRGSRWGVLRWALIVLLAAAAALAAKAWSDTVADPEVMRLTAQLEGLPPGTPPMRLLLLSDIHVAGPDMPPERLVRIVKQANALRPDMVLIAGDFVSEKRTATRLYPADAAIAPLAALEAPLGKIAVPGNHDHWFGIADVRRELERAEFTVLANAAVRAGPLAIGGIDDDYTGRADLSATLAAVDRLDGGRVLLSHSPDPFPDLPADFGLMLAGHTHCGQIRYPWGGSPATMSAYGDRYACGAVRENGNLLVTTAGLGTSVLPFRLFSRPEMWLIEVVPAAR
ncbi:metallophosphoesterase [Pelagerythrobacter rhizovicinus]|uniref:Phosphohydrolase n=1 Tax=Pelagerythrobacter rhizovicinus TaxID=2268576 RepID=A0A4Q2KPX9_9SPHN|nr:metallophosphoesterase [Pelagerythrobacter rhizovicinus]RXZ66450.1 phosphohydrolase [Pelagerythrobacter rhizovicinus]